MQDRLPLDFAELLDAVLVFAGPLLAGTACDAESDPQTRSWTKS